MKVEKVCKLILVFTIMVFNASLPAAFDVSVDKEQRAFTVKTERLEVTFKDAMIVNLKNLKTGELICNEKYSDIKIPIGLGHMDDGIDSMVKIHAPWGCSELEQTFSGVITNYHYPGDKSKFSYEKIENGIKATWTGLKNSKNEFPSESLIIDVGMDENGTLTFKASAVSDKNGVFGITVPLVNIIPESRFFLSSFGGMTFDKSDKPALRTFGTAPFQEAPVMAIETEKGSLALWKEDEKFHPYFTFFNWSGNSFSFAFEHHNLMPFDQHKKINSVIWKLDVFDGGWKNAMNPYKKWYSKYFAKELKIRDSAKWADKIGVIIDVFRTEKIILDKITELFSPESVMFQEWNARAAGFGKEWPDWTPRKGYVEKVKTLHNYGFKIMSYVVTYCVTYNSPVFIRDNLKEKVLTRKSTIWGKYGKPSLDSEMDSLIGDTQGFSSNKDQFAGWKDGQGFYSDPLCTAWRKYHAEQMKWWNTITGTDANYEDTAGCSGDFGNGIVDGKFGAQGSVEMMRELLETQPNIPMASEYGPDTIAFSVKWPLQYAQVWGNDAFRKKRIHRQRPVNAFLFDYRTWIPAVRTDKNDLRRHVVTACSDASGGMGMMIAATTEDFECTRGFRGHMKWRSQIFADRNLIPYFDFQNHERDLVCMYKDKDDGIYKYYDDGKIQRMLGPDNKELYARIDNTSKLDTQLYIPEWPAYSENSIFGLNPDNRYALFPKKDTQEPVIRLSSLPEGILINRYYSGDNYAVIVLDKNEKGSLDNSSLFFELNKNFEKVCINGMAKEIPKEAKKIKIDVIFPAYILFSSSARIPVFDEPLEKDFYKLNIRDISNGLEEYVVKDILKFKSSIKPSASEKPIQSLNLESESGESNIDFLISVPSKDSSLKFYVKIGKPITTTTAKIYINGKIIKILELYAKNPKWNKKKMSEDKMFSIKDDNCHELTIPLGEYAGQNILISIASKGNCNVSIPLLIQEQKQKISDKVM